MVAAKRWTTAIWQWLEGNARTHPDEIQHAAKVAVWARWIFLSGCLFLLAYRPAIDLYSYTALSLLAVAFLTLNLGLHVRLLLKKPISWSWMLVASAIEVFMIASVITIGNGFEHFFFVAFYPSLALIAVAFTSIVMWVMWTTLVALIYTAISVFVGSGVDIEMREEKVLFGRILTMYLVVLVVNLISRIERIRRRAAVRSERLLLEDRVRVSRTIHDTSAQAAYMVNLGIESAIDLADKSNEQLMSTLEATSNLAKSAMWELRKPLNMASIFEGKTIGDVLRSHIGTFTAITSVPAELSISGGEEELDVETRAVLYSVAHNALTNAFRHAEATSVDVILEFDSARIRLTVRDNGIGLPDDFEVRGHGIPNMRSDAERIGGRLSVQSGESLVGTAVVCEIPYAQLPKGD
ncbi:MAG: ATP-binding protein [Chloroflexi bacterium]|nr:ATP-binding protein [Chloroflexota bacterium]